MNKTSQKIAETVHELNEEIRHVDGVHLESSQIGIVDTVILHQDNGSGEIILWTSEETTRFSKKMVFNAVLEVVEDLNKAKDAIEHHIEE